MTQAEDLTDDSIDELIAHRNGTCEQGGGACPYCADEEVPHHDTQTHTHG